MSSSSIRSGGSLVETRPTIALIAAMTAAGVIGKNNQLPWHLPEDLQYFKKVTSGKPIIMGRKTFESIGRPLPQRKNIVLTQSKDFHFAGVSVVHSLEEAIKAAGDAAEIMVIGGAKVYEAFLPKASRLYLTLVHEAYSGDTYFPTLNPLEWETIEEKPYPLFTTKVLVRRI